MDNMSLADRAVQALSMVKAMDEGLEIEHPERHAIRGLTRVAQQIIESAMRSAVDIAFQADELRKLARKIEADGKPDNAELRGADRHPS